MQARWTVTYGPQFADSKKACKMSKSRFDLHFAALKLELERDPFRYSEPYLDELHRAMDTHDFFVHEGGAALSAYVVLDPDQLEAEIQWVEAGPLPKADEEPDETDEEGWDQPAA
jgi:hypothetical protein